MSKKSERTVTAGVRLDHIPITKTGMPIRKPVAGAFEAFANPDKGIEDH